MANQSNSENSDVNIAVMPDGHIDMYYISRSIQAALEYSRVGDVRAVNATAHEINIGKGIITCSMQALGLECALKGLYQALKLPFAKKHDLSLLFKRLPEEYREGIEAKWAELTLFPEVSETTFWDFIEFHKKDFEQWRYLDADKLESSYFGLYAATMAVHRVVETESTGD